MTMNLNLLTARKLSAHDFSKLPKKSECYDSAWELIKALGAFWKSYVRSEQYPDQRAGHLAKCVVTAHRIEFLCGLPADSVYNTLIAEIGIHYRKKSDDFTANAELTFKKYALRTIARKQSGTFTLANTVKDEKSTSKKSKKAPWVLAEHSDAEIAERFCCPVEAVPALRATVTQIIAC